MELWLTALVTVLCSVVASSGFWVIIQKWSDKHDSKAQMILGLGHDRLVFLCMKYIERGNITHDELENLHKYLYAPYSKLGGNGTVTRLMKIIDSLQVKSTMIETVEKEKII